MQTADSEIFHVIVAIVEEFVDVRDGLFDEIGRGIDVAHCLDCLLEDALIEMHCCILKAVLAETLVVYRITFSRTSYMIPLVCWSFRPRT
jgi:hypothetical protein